MKGNTEEAIQFLENWKSGGPWVLTAIPVEQSRTTTRTFDSKNLETLIEWIEALNGKENLYFMVNPATKELSVKAKKTDVRGMLWLHTDLDPRPREELKSERERALRLLRAFAPPPTVIIDSGGGFQGFWKLSTEEPVNGDESKAAELEAYNTQIALLLGADMVHNLDRIMRLPGTVNLPNEKKRKKGRVPALARVEEADWSRVYPLGAFTAAPRLQASASGNGGASGPTVKLSGNLPRIGSLDDLPERVSARTKMLIVQGDDPDDPTRYPSRSEVCFAVCCELVRAGVDDDTIAAILLDKDYGVSGHVLSQGRPTEYAARQIRRAREEAIHPELRRLNEMHAVIEDLGGKCRVVSEVMDFALRRTRLSRQSFDDFRNRYMHIPIEVGRDEDGKPVLIPLGKYWLGNANRRQYRTIVFAPGKETPDAYNLWRGFACEVRPGDCSLFLSHVKENICSGNEEHYEYLLSWMARAVQRPDSPGEIAVVLRGRMGTGKGKLAKIFGSLWGRHFLAVSDPKHLVGSFNAHLRDCVVLFGDEAFFAGDKRHESILKTLITEETIVVEAKGVDAEAAPNYVHLLLSSNSDWVVPAGADDRRFFALDVSDSKAQDTKYFAALDREVENGGREALLHFLMTRDLSSFEVRHVPKTVTLQDQKLLSLSPVEEWWFEKLSDGKVGRSDTWPEEVPKDELQTDANRYMERQKIMRRPSPTMLLKFLKKVSPKGWPRVASKIVDVAAEDEYGRPGSKRVRGTVYELSPLAELRERWDARFGGPYAWLEEAKPDEDTRAPF